MILFMQSKPNSRRRIMDDIIHVNASPTREHAEKKRLTYKDADNYGLFCAYRNDGTQSWVVLPNHVLELINAMIKPWVGLTDEEIDKIWRKQVGAERANINSFTKEIEAKLKEKNT
jgi:hypothetical protein